jgi:hypothetical protein
MYVTEELKEARFLCETSTMHSESFFSNSPTNLKEASKGTRGSGCVLITAVPLIKLFAWGDDDDDLLLFFQKQNLEGRVEPVRNPVL